MHQGIRAVLLLLIGHSSAFISGTEIISDRLIDTEVSLLYAIADMNNNRKHSGGQAARKEAGRKQEKKTKKQKLAGEKSNIGQVS